MTQEKLEHLKLIAFNAEHGRCDPSTVANQIADVLKGSAKSIKAADRLALEEAATASLLRKSTGKEIATSILEIIHRHEPTFTIPEETKVGEADA